MTGTARARLLALILPLLAACAPLPPGGGASGGAPGGAPGTDACGASGYQGLIGSNIAAITLPAGLDMRIVREGEMITMDFIAGRLNLWVSRSGVVQRVYCG